MYTDSQNFVQPIECNKKNYLILNKKYDILVELQIQNEKIPLRKVPTHIGIKA